MNIALIMMGGMGMRFGASIPKQFVETSERPIFSLIIDEMEKIEEIDKLILVVNKDWIQYTKDLVEKTGYKKIYGIVSGGECRSESVLNGLRKASEIAEAEDVVLMHDVSHPYVDGAGIREMIEAVRAYGGATLGQRQYDTCYRINEDDMIEAVIPRQEIVSGASPEGFRFEEIYSIYKNANKEELEKMTSAGAIALAHGINMKVCTLNMVNLKITYQSDMELLENTKRGYFFRA